MDNDQLKKLLLSAKEQYYNAGNSELSDLEYDALEVEYNNSLPVDDGHQDQTIFSHPYLSLRKGKYLDVTRFIGNSQYVVFPKLDGVSMELHLFPDGTLKAVTRGGKLVTETFKKFVTPFWEDVDLKLNLTDTVVVRGEVTFYKNHLQKLKELGFSNLRNSVAGLLNRKDLSEDTSNIPKMDFHIWRWMNPPRHITTTTKALITLRDYNFPIVDFVDLELPKLLEYEQNPSYGRLLQTDWPYELDGLVIFKDFFSEWGDDSGKDVYQNSIAWKFESPSAITTIDDISWHLGLTGRMTPVAVLKPVEIAGTMVSNVNLHNHENMFKLNALPGATVVVAKANDIIPTIFQKSETPENLLNKDVLPKTCPVCDSVLNVQKNLIKCVNSVCDNKLSGILEKWAKTHDWKYFSDDALKDLVPFFKICGETPIIKILNLTKEDLSNNMTGGKATRLWNHYNKALKNVTPETLFGSLNIELVGVKNAKSSLENLTNVFDLPTYLKQKIDNNTAYIYEQNLYNWINENHFIFIQICSYLQSKGLDVINRNTSLGRVIITGELPGCTRDEAFSIIQSKGYEPSNSITKGSSYLITEDKTSGTTKLQKAEKYGIPIISWKEFLTLP